MIDSTTPELHSPLHQIHVDLGASFTDFAGWQMPVRYSSELEEHRAVRTTAGIFDLSHMAEILVTGPEAPAALDHALAGHISAIGVGQAKYTLLLCPDGGIVDDVVVYRTHEHRFGVVANAGNRFAAAGALSVRATGYDATVVDESDALALIAVQGPNSRAIVEGLSDFTPEKPIAELKYYWSTLAQWHGDELLIGRTGYTGEDGFELYVRASVAAELWRELMTLGEPHGLVPAGLACRDTLRLEAGMPLYGHELSLETFPSQAGLGRVVKLEGKGDFVGREANERGAAPDARVLVGLVSEGRRAGRAGYDVLAAGEGEPAVVGTVTSGALSPTLGHPIAMAYVEPSCAEPGTQLLLDVRGTQIPASVVPLPFYKRVSPERKASS